MTCYDCKHVEKDEFGIIVLGMDMLPFCARPKDSTCIATLEQEERNNLLEAIQIATGTSMMLPERGHIKALFEVVQACQEANANLRNGIDSAEATMKELEASFNDR